jgi:mono/diheme cytochrome c family protein
VDNQFAQSKFLVQRLTMMAMAIALIFLVVILSLRLYNISDPYVKEVLSLTGDEIRGHAMYEINCAACHGGQADGNVGPSLHHVPKRKSRVSLIYQVISGKTPPMPKFQPSPQEMADLLSYLERL